MPLYVGRFDDDRQMAAKAAVRIALRVRYLQKDLLKLILKEEIELNLSNQNQSISVMETYKSDLDRYRVSAFQCKALVNKCWDLYKPLDSDQCLRRAKDGSTQNILCPLGIAQVSIQGELYYYYYYYFQG